MRILLKFVDSLNFKRVGKATVFAVSGCHFLSYLKNTASGTLIDCSWRPSKEMLMFVTEQLPSQFCVKIQGNMDILRNKEVFLAVFRWIQTSQMTGQVSVA